MQKGELNGEKYGKSFCIPESGLAPVFSIPVTEVFRK